MLVLLFTIHYISIQSQLTAYGRRGAPGSRARSRAALALPPGTGTVHLTASSTVRTAPETSRRLRTATHNFVHVLINFES